jgi:hypothetical protein
MKTLLILVALVVAGAAAAAGFVHSGAYDVAADQPHWPLTARLMATLRDRSIATRAAGIAIPPDIDSPERVRRGAGNYDAMCVGCHLKPGLDDSELRKGLYPQPPDLARHKHDHEDAGLMARRFWVIKHGIKMTAMPAWSLGGVDDATIWDMVALLQSLPGLSAQDYAALVAASDGHTHAGAAAPRDHVDPPGAKPHTH